MSDDSDVKKAMFLSVAESATDDEAALYLAAADGDVDVALVEYHKAKKGSSGGGGGSVSSAAKAGPPEKKKPQQYFAGGGDSSGQAIISPGDDNDGPDYGEGKELVDGLFQRARDQGATDITDTPQHDASFQGSGRRLGFQPGPSPVMQAVKRRVVKVRITFYANGFVVGDETVLRDPRSPESQVFLAQLDKGHIPKSLGEQHKDCNIDVELVDRSGKEYEAPKYTAYGGEGRSMRASGDEPSSPSAAAGGGGGDSASTLPTGFALEEDQPKCKVVLVLPDGARQEVMVNPDRHIVNDLRGLAASAASLTAGNFDLIVRDFPKQRLLTDFTETIAAAKLKNAMVMVHKK